MLSSQPISVQVFWWHSQPMPFGLRNAGVTSQTAIDKTAATTINESFMVGNHEPVADWMRSVLRFALLMFIGWNVLTPVIRFLLVLKHPQSQIAYRFLYIWICDISHFFKFIATQVVDFRGGIFRCMFYYVYYFDCKIVVWTSVAMISQVWFRKCVDCKVFSFNLLLLSLPNFCSFWFTTILCPFPSLFTMFLAFFYRVIFSFVSLLLKILQFYMMANLQRLILTFAHFSICLRFYGLDDVPCSVCTLQIGPDWAQRANL